jgi:hypothetical protein
VEIFQSTNVQRFECNAVDLEWVFYVCVVCLLVGFDTGIEPRILSGLNISSAYESIPSPWVES